MRLAACLLTGIAWTALTLAAGTPSTNSLWSLTPLNRPALPSGTRADHPIDAFLRAKLEQRGLRPSPEADRRTLLRRLSYGLTGLPPTWEEAEAFVRVANGDAYNRLLDRLLASPRHGEHWARHWLDTVHYADTHGNDHDYARPNAWPYRDYVVRAFNADKPYTRFVQEQIAGDALFTQDPEALVALGFLAAGPWDETLMVGVREDTFDHKLAQVLDRDDMVSTTMSTFQSLTVHCARCHDHKFDPISQREYYGLQAVFAGIDRADRPFDSDPAVHSRRRELLARKRALEKGDASAAATLDSPGTVRRVSELEALHRRRERAWTRLEIEGVAAASGAAIHFTRLEDESWFVDGPRQDKDVFLVTAASVVRGIRAFRLEALPDTRLPGKGPGRYEPTGNFHLSEFKASLRPADGAANGKRLEFSHATADHSDGGDTVGNAIDGRDDTHWSVHPRYGERHEAVFELAEPQTAGPGAKFAIRLEHHGKTAHQLGRFRLSVCTDALPSAERAPLPATLIDLLRKPETERTAGERRDLARRVLLLDIERDLAALPPPQMVYAATRDFAPTGSFKPAAQPRPIRILARGDLNKPGEEVAPGALSCVADLGTALALDDPGDEGARRSALAYWLSNPQNPITWRSIVNRVWHYHFGRGLCASPNDFGQMGDAPSHPELLDWMAVWFRDDARGSLKALHRLILTSHAYRQQSADNTAASTLDPDNRLLWRMNRLRLTAEAVRDSLLQMSGRLDLAMGGPAAVQFLHRGKATFMPDGGAPPFLDYAGFPVDSPENSRRALYRFQFRTVPDPLMDALDAPDGSALTPVRNESTTPIQAFAMMNNAFVIRLCEHIGRSVSDASPRHDGRATATAIDRLFRVILQRVPTPEEARRLAEYADRHGLANGCHVLINGNEFLYLD